MPDKTRPGRWFILIFLQILAWSPVKKADAQVFGEAARTEFFGGFGIRTFYSRINRTELLTDGNRVAGPNAPASFVNMMPVALVYGARPRLSLIAVLPAIARSSEQVVNGTRMSTDEFGLGDITLLAKYRFFKKDAFLASRQLAIQAGVKLPTGESGFGTGSVDYRTALTFTEAQNRWIFSGDLAYALNTEADGFEAGGALNYDVAAKFRAFPSRFTDGGSIHQLFIFLEFNGMVWQKSKVAGLRVADSGGHQISVSPGFQFFLLENLLIESGIQIPVVQELNGTQLGTDFHFRAGLRWFLIP